jgi:hypothetical protein
VIVFGNSQSGTHSAQVPRLQPAYSIAVQCKLFSDKNMAQYKIKCVSDRLDSFIYLSTPGEGIGAIFRKYMLYNILAQIREKINGMRHSL